MADTMLSIVDDQDNIVGRELRSVIHREGLRHREVHVWFVTPDWNLIVQRRSALKETYPGHLDSTVGGHVEEGQEYMDAAIMEVSEETGLNVTAEDLLELAKVDVTQIEEATRTHNTVWRMVYLYRYSGSLQDLQVEADAGAGFEVVALADVMAKRGETVAQMVPGLFNEGYMPAWKALQKAVMAG